MRAVDDDAEFEVSIADNPDGDDQCSLAAGFPVAAPNTPPAALPTRAGILCVLVADDALDVRAADAAFWRTSVAHGTAAPPPPVCSMLIIQMEQQQQ